MSLNCHETIDFDLWSELASTDPERFEAMRQLMIEAVIDAASDRCQDRLRSLQWRIDMIRERAANPMAACISLSSLMWDSFAGERGLVQVLNHWQNHETLPRQEAKILAFPSRRG